MKKLIAFLLFLLPGLSVAFAQQIRDIDESVLLHRDGSARVTQVWDVQATSGTEFYLPFEHLGPMDISDLSVSENGVEFVSEGDGWDTDRSRDAKRGRCGIVRKSSGVELCWGVGDYGDHRWTVSYTVRGLAMQMGEYTGLYFTFVNPGMMASPQHVRVRLLNGTGGPEWTSDNVKVWGFGSESEIFVEDGAVRAESLEPFGSDDEMTVLVRFDDGLFAPEVQYEKDFEEIQKMAFKGSDYPEKLTFGEIFWLVVGGLFVLIFTPIGWVLLAIALAIYYGISYYMLGRKYKKSIYGKARIKGWYRDIPLKGSISASYYALEAGSALHSGRYDNNLLAAYFLRWVLQGKVGVESDPKSKHRVNLRFEHNASFDDAFESDLYKMIYEASGSNHLLEAGELEKYARKSFKKVSDIPSRERARGFQWFENRGLTRSKNELTPEGQEKARHLIEFKNFLEAFTLSAERGAIEVTLWEDYLVFAALFGIADKVAKQFEKLYPAQFREFSSAAGMHGVPMSSLLSVSHDLSAAALRNAVLEKASRSGGSGSGGGSSRSHGGGGSFSHGGGGHSFGHSHGGGTR